MRPTYYFILELFLNQLYMKTYIAIGVSVFLKCQYNMFFLVMFYI